MDKAPELNKNLEKKDIYALSEEDFSRFPEVIEEYKFRDKVTRENFINFIIQSFAISRGNLGSQINFCRYLLYKEGFDYRRTFQAFCKKYDSFDQLSPEEQNLFFSSYGKVKKHQEMGEEGIKRELKRFALTAESDSYAYNKPLASKSNFFDFAAIEKQADFSQAVAINNANTQEEIEEK